jgi:FtsP/CotA-like multicopper oxidase with cupredoxin domain
MASLVPIVPKNVGNYESESNFALTALQNSENQFRWYLNTTTMLIEWENPVSSRHLTFRSHSDNQQTLLQVENNDTIVTFPESSALFELPNAHEWIYIIIQTAIPVPHPIHLHGHDFHVLAQGTGTYDDTVALNLVNPPRRDVALLPLSGYLVLAFETDNPGAWLMHW